MIDKIWQVLRPSLQVILLLAAVVVAGVVTMHEWNARRAAEDTAARVTREADLSRAGLLVSSEQTQRQLEADLAAAKKSSSEFAAALSEAQSKLDHAKPVMVLHASTGPVPVESHPAASSAAHPAPVPGETSAPGACVLREGEMGEIRVTEATLEERSGARVVIGAAECWRRGGLQGGLDSGMADPEPDVRLFAGRYSVPVSSAATLAPPASSRARWGVGTFVGVGRGGWTYGPAIALPPASVLGLQIEATVGAGLGSGTAQAGATVIGRW